METNAFASKDGSVNSNEFELDRFSMMVDLIHLLSSAGKAANEFEAG